MSDAKTPPGGNGHSGFQPRWRLDLDDDGHGDLRPQNADDDEIKTGEERRPSATIGGNVEELWYLWVRSSHVLLNREGARHPE